MRSNFVWEAILVGLLIMVAAGAFSAWKLGLTRAKKPPPQIVQPPDSAAVNAAIKAVEMYAPFALNLGANRVYVEHTSVETTAMPPRGIVQPWIINGHGSPDYLDGAMFNWVVQIDDENGETTLREIRINGDVVFQGKAKTPTSSASPAAAG